MVKITETKAVGSFILCKILSQQDALGTEMLITSEQSNQGIVKSIGPLVDPNCGLKVGDRVCVGGKHPKVENPENENWLCVNLFDIKAVLTVEEKPEVIFETK